MTITSLFPSPVLVDVLALFLRHPDKAFYQSAIAEQTGHTLFLVQRSLVRIEESGLILKTKDGNRVYYKAIPSHPAFEGLRLAFSRTIAIADIAKEAIIPIQDKIQIAFIYGSVATGTETAESDLDLFVLGSVSLKELASLASYDALAERLKREINPVVYSLEIFQRKMLEGNRFIEELLSCPKIWLIGDQDEFARLAEGRNS